MVGPNARSLPRLHSEDPLAALPRPVSLVVIAGGMNLVERGPSRYWQGFGENCWWPRPGWHFWVRRAESNRHLFPVRLNCSA
jgi:hypothetical protein